MAEGVIPIGSGSRADWVEPNGKPTRTVIWFRKALHFLTALILGQALVYHHAGPFVWIFLILVWQRGRASFAPAALGGLVGVGLAISMTASLVLLALLLLIPFPAQSPKWRFTQWPLIVAGGAALFLVRQPLDPWTLSWAVAVGVAGLMIYVAAIREWARLGRGEGDRSTLVLFLTAAGAFIAGLEGFHAGIFLPAWFVGGLFILLGAVTSGPSGGALAGATLGITLALRGQAAGTSVGSLVAAGFAAGWAGRRHWRLAALGLFAGMILYAILIHMDTALMAEWLSFGVAGLCWQLAPAGGVHTLTGWTHALLHGEDPESLPDRLRHLSEVLSEMASAFRVEEEHPAAEAHVTEAVVASVCRRCSLYRTCWESEFYRTYRGVLDLAGRAGQEMVTSDDLTGDLARRCIRPEAVAQSVNAVIAQERERAAYRLRVRESRQLAETQLAGISRLITEMASDWIPDRVRYLRKKPVIDYVAGVARRPRMGGVVSGDSPLVSDLSLFKAVLGLSDGMGVGPRAAWESGTAMALVEKMLQAGFAPRLVVRAVNTTLLLRSADDDHFATLDLLVLDRVTRTTELIKVAAPPTFLCRRGQVEVISARGLPVGILPSVTVESLARTVEPGDVLVMVTDGVLEERGEDKLRGFLEALPNSDAQVMAETILSFMLGHHEDGRDDASVMVVKILAHGLRREAQTALSGVAVGEWRRLTAVDADNARWGISHSLGAWVRDFFPHHGNG